jgi:DNA polymerase-3 subunit delta'
MTLLPEEPGKAIVIDSVRQLFNKLVLKPLYAGGRWVLVQPADRLNAAAANGFLKGLEEPPERTAFILITEHPQHLPATVRSRCQAVRCAAIDPAVADAWLQQQGVSAERMRLLQLAQGSPQRALAYAQCDALVASQASFTQWLAIAEGNAAVPQVAEQWQQGSDSVDLALRLHWLNDWLTDIIKLKMGAAADRLPASTAQKPLQALAERLELQPLFRYYDAVTECRSLLTTPVNQLLATEALLLHWSTLTAPHHG